MFSYRLDYDSDIPVYRQLADQMHAQIRSGALRTGTQLPTVREMAAITHISCGTAKRVYDRLRELGDIEMKRRSGSFVKYVREEGESRKLMAMNAIDTMLRRLGELNFSPREIQIFLNLKMREWGLRQSGLRIAVITSCPEIDGDFEAQLERIGNVRVQRGDMRQMREYPYNINEQTDVLLASGEDEAALRKLLPDPGKLLRVELAPQTASLIAAAGLPGTLGVVCESDEFFRKVAALPGLRCVKCTGEIPDGIGALIVPRYTEAFGEETRARIAEYEAAGKCVRFGFEIDAGSMLYLQERIDRIREERQLRPLSFDF